MIFQHGKHVYSKTGWFESEAPLYTGVYERDIEVIDYSSAPLYGYWDGVTWYLTARTPERALERYEEGMESTYQWTDTTQRWRGLTRPVR